MANRLRASSYMPMALAMRQAKEALTQQESTRPTYSQAVSGHTPQGWVEESTRVGPTPRPRRTLLKEKANTAGAASEPREDSDAERVRSNSPTPEEENKVLRNHVARLQETVNALNGTINDLRKELKEMRKEREMGRLSSHSGNRPAENPSGSSAKAGAPLLSDPQTVAILKNLIKSVLEESQTTNH